MSEAAEETEAAPSRPTHSVKVPRLYKVAAKILVRHAAGQGSLKTLVYDSRKHHPNLKALLALVTTCTQHKAALERVLAELGLLKRLDPALAKILATELVWGKQKLAGQSRPVLAVLGCEERLRDGLGHDAGGDGAEEAEAAPQPRYVRVNTLKITWEQALEQLRQDPDFRQVTYDREGTDYEHFLSLVASLEPGQFLVDFHVSRLLVFAPRTQFYAHAMYKEGRLLLQDKASCLPVQALALPDLLSSSKPTLALDACAAPGMKTTQLAAVLAELNPANRVVAVERDAKRAQVLRQMLRNSGADSIVTKVINQDFLGVNPKQFPKVEYIVLDPSCSGSGIVSREGKVDLSSERLQRLSSLQTKLLRHAAKFANVKRIVYSTCSTADEENEQVLERVLSSDSQLSSRFRLSSCLDSWGRRGRGSFEHVDPALCVRADAEQDRCIGFFVAVLERREGGAAGQHSVIGMKSKKSKKNKNKKRKQ